MEKPSISFFVMNFLLLFLVIVLILIVFEMHGFAFVLELGVLLIFMFFFIFAMLAVYRNKKWGWTVLGATLILLLVNTFFIILLKNAFETVYITTVFFSVIGLIVTLLNLIGAKEPDDGTEEGYDKIKNYYPYIDKIEPKQKTEAKEEARVEKTFTPGKFVASKKANKFHSPKCDWAKRVSKPNQIWFNSREEAEKQGFEADKCVV